ncbi:hypothetical protein [Pseudoduganella violaceinigra]|uniref:hypothetical protein n=1 Tax=Pseudoduganella violaceinigra TaxID=246602 RepID=UPI00040BC4BA|nr:hypothetical protein [Pseudoduganella violaceinigra]
MNLLKTLAIAFAAFAVLAPARAIEPGERKNILDAIRPLAAQEANQPVRIKVDTLNVDSGWAVLVGNLVGPPGQYIDWDRSFSCKEDLDRMLWVVLHKNKKGWQVKHMDICASEPPYWYIEQYGGLVWPCGVYKGLQVGEETLETQCRRERSNK